MPIRCSRSARITPLRRFLRLTLALAALGGAAGCEQAPADQARSPAQTIGLYTSLPVIWQESERVSDLLSQPQESHWLLAELRHRGNVVPLDSLDGNDGALPLPGDAVLVLAQPRPLSPQENVALDNWVRGGGRVLLFADPMLTEDSIYPLGDPRRPQDIALLSPILTRWGLALEFDDAQAPEERMASAGSIEVPVHFAGRFRTTDPACTVPDGGLLATCRIGAGAVLALADAALLERGDSQSVDARKAAFASLLERLSGLRPR